MGLIQIAKDIGQNISNTALGIGSTALGSGGSAFTNTVYSTMFKEYLVSGDMSNGILMKRAEKIVPTGSQNRKSDDNLISSGSAIDVQPNQCMIIVENGKIVEYCAVPGRYSYDASTQPTLIGGNQSWMDNLKAVGKEVLTQWQAGGQRFSTQRVYFINMCELLDAPIKWGLGDIAFHHTTVMKNGAPPIELDITLKGNGQVTMRVADPIKFFNNIGAQMIGGDNDGLITITDDVAGTRDDGIISNLKSGVRDKIAEALSILGFENAIPYTAIRAYSSKVSGYINNLLSNEWAGLRGFEVCSFTINGAFMPTEEDKQKIQDMQTSFTMGANLNAANYDVQKTMARGFEQAGANGGVSGLVGMGMSMGQFGNIGQMQNVQPYPQQSYGQQSYGNPAPIPVATPINNEGAWKCECGAENTGNFCFNCGGKKPVSTVDDTWTCSCGKENTGNFCSNCGNRKPVSNRLVCDKCGWNSEGASDMRFCPNCGDPVTPADFK